MDRLSKYRQIIRQLIEQYGQYIPAQGDIEIETIFDESQDHYELIYSGWNGSYRVHGSVLHIDIRKNKIWIQQDGTEDGIANELVKAGIPHEDIVLAFKSPDVRQYTDFASS